MCAIVPFHDDLQRVIFMKGKGNAYALKVLYSFRHIEILTYMNDIVRPL